jgi:hypothetical protein
MVLSGVRVVVWKLEHKNIRRLMKREKRIIIRVGLLDEIIAVLG